MIEILVGDLPQREKLRACDAAWIAAVRELPDEDYLAVVKEVKKRLKSPKLAAEVNTLLAELARGRVIARNPAPSELDPVVDGDLRTQLEAAIARDPAAQTPYLGYGDYLESIGDPFGPLIGMDRELAKNPGHKAVQRARHEYLVANRPAILGLLADHEARWAGKHHYASPRAKWHMGFLSHVCVHEQPSVALADLLHALLDAPGPGRFIQELELRYPSDRRWVHVLAARPRPTLRHLRIRGESDATGVFAALPNLVELACSPTPSALAEAATLHHLAILTGWNNDWHTGMALTNESARAIVEARWPALHTVAFRLQDDEGTTVDADAILPLLDGTCVPGLRSLELVGIPFGDALIERFVASPLLPQLQRVQFRFGTIGEVGARRLLANAAKLAHIAFTLDENYIPPTLAAELATAFPQLETGQQHHDPDPTNRVVPTVE